MKKLLLLICLICSISIGTPAQDKQIVETTAGSNTVAYRTTKQITPTTLEEYNYLTKGLRTQEEQGLDMKRGYRFKDTSGHQTGIYTFMIRNLIREDESIAGVSVVAKVGNKAHYICIPIGKEDGKGESTEPQLLFLRNLYDNKDQILAVSLQIAMAERLSSLSAHYYQQQK